MINITVGDKYRTLQPTEHNEYYYGYWTLAKGSIVKIIGEFPNLLNAVRFEVLSGEMKGKKIVFNKFKCTTDLLQKLLTTEEGEGEKKRPRTLSKIHKIKRENRVLSSRIKTIEDSAYIGNELSHKDLHSIKLLSQRIGSNGNKIQRLRTKLSQLNKAG